MKIFKSLGSGAQRAFKSWKGVLIIWLISLLLVSLFVIPMKGILRTGFGSSTITETLRSGINIDVISDLEQYFSSLISYLSSGFFLLIFLGILINSFLAGGLFSSLKKSSGRLSTPEFFRTSARFFWYFLGMYLMIALIIIVFAFLIVGLPVGLTVKPDTGAGTITYIIGIISVSIFSIVEVILLLVADYARAWLVSAEKPAFFKALGFGFSETFRHFGSSFPMMLIIMVLIVLFGWMAAKIIGIWKPGTGGGVFLLFVVSQILFFIKVLLKAWRYGSVTSLMETNKSEVPSDPSVGTS